MSSDLIAMPLDANSDDHFKRLLSGLKAWSNDHQTLLGVSEVAAGAAILYAGINSGAVALGVDAVLSIGGKLGLLAGGPAAVGLYVLGNVGIAAVGGAVAAPASLLALCGGALTSLAGYTIGDVVQKVVDPITLVDILGPGSLVALGVALMLDGARRLVKDLRLAQGLSAFRDSVIYLAQIAGESILRSAEEFAAWIAALARNPSLAGATTGAVVASALAAQAAAASSVTVLGSSTLGSLGMAIGLISAPVWPVIAATGAASAVSYLIWRASTRATRNKT